MSRFALGLTVLIALGAIGASIRFAPAEPAPPPKVVTLERAPTVPFLSEPKIEPKVEPKVTPLVQTPSSPVSSAENGERGNVPAPGTTPSSAATGAESGERGNVPAPSSPPDPGVPTPSTPESPTPSEPKTPDLPVSSTPSGFTVQVGAFRNRANAERLSNRLIAARLRVSYSQAEPGGLYRVVIGPFESQDAARAAAARAATFTP